METPVQLRLTETLNWWEAAFDGMLETIIADYRYIPQARTISVDSRYMLWTLDKFHGAENILNELTITN